MSKIETISPPWPLKRVKAFTTTRFGGVSNNDFFSLNLASHVGDDLQAVQENRALLKEQLDLPHQPLWVTQVSGANVLEIPVNAMFEQEYLALKHKDSKDLDEHERDISKFFEVDALYTSQANQVCAILTADCVPLLLASDSQDEVAAVHAGWRGLVAGVVENAVQTFKADQEIDRSNLYAWIGPAIGPESFIVGAEVVMEFCQKDRDFATCFTPYPQEKHKWLGNLPKVTAIILRKLGLKEKNIFFSDIDTVQDQRFFSHRKEKLTGRFATLIWFEEKK
ncbi:hypothetical protein CJP74_03235 [Psittacicella melopsittaci]|uniref:Purine nucleoside phosphorylase n=1 Tax=Psittacicella melopsittaci TaxID=2028576 RepID=A0A3A1Y711_9GAMM|nr:peptidoglycan editing factor PgeF [Psittacicella melopsittaci]RIY33008.1 hypothetical protein CJP74_03235 [Psittacicella melopsittaci]